MSGQGPLPYLSVSSVEVANAARTVGYLRNGLGDTDAGHWTLNDGDLCGVLYRLSGGTCVTPEAFSDPATDPAPWYDASEAASESFLGAVLLDITGYDSTRTRVVTPRVHGLGGASFSGERRNPREWSFRAALVSADDRGAEYGLRWLTAALGASSCDTCDTGEMTVRLSCPPANCSDDTVGEWISYDVALTDGPKEVEKWAPRGGDLQDVLAGCRNITVVEWRMVSGNPFLYKRPVQCLAPETIGVAGSCTDICDWLFGDPGDPHCCSVTPPERGTLAPIFTLASVSGMGAVLLEAWESCPEATGTEEPILQMQIESVPPGSTVIVDCAQRTIEVATPDPVTGEAAFTDGGYLISLPEGRGLEWIEVRDCDEIGCFCARTAAPCSRGDDTSVSISTQLREG